MQLYSFLESFVANAVHYENVTVIYRAFDQTYQEGYLKVQDAFPTFRFVRQPNANPQAKFKPMVLEHTFSGSAEYVTFAVDDIICTGLIDFEEGIDALESTGAYGFYYRLGKNTTYCYATDTLHTMPPMRHVGGGIYSWTFAEGDGDFDYPNSVDMTLLRKKELEPIWRQLYFTQPNTLEGAWAMHADHARQGLCYERSRMVNIPLNVVATAGNRNMKGTPPLEMLKLFMSGLKIDIQPFQGLLNRAAHEEHPFDYVTR